MARNFDGYESYPLNLQFPTMDVTSLQYLHSKLEKALPSLFIRDDDNCRALIYAAIPSSLERPIEDLKSRTSIRGSYMHKRENVGIMSISSLDEL